MKSENYMPRRAEPGSAGYDFYAPHDIVLKPGEWTDVDTGVCFDGTEMVRCPMESPEDTVFATQWVMLLFPRSGLGFRYGMRFANSVGVVDQSYRDTIKARMTCDTECTIKKGERFMQGVIVPFGVFKDEMKPIHDERKGGFGSTGQ